MRLGTAALLLFALFLNACSPIRTVDAWSLLNELETGSAVTGTPEPISRRQIRYGPTRRGFNGDLYESLEPEKDVALLLVPGAVPGGNNDPRLIASAESFARKGFRVLVPELSELNAPAVSVDDTVQIAHAVKRAAKVSEAEGKRAVGIIAISYATGPSVIAALDPLARNDVSFILSVGGYYDMEALITFFTTGQYRGSSAEAWRYREPNVYGKWVFLRDNALRMATWDDKEGLAAIAERKLRRPNARIDDLASRLGPEGRSVLRLLENRDPDQVPELVAALPEEIREGIYRLDLKRYDLGAATFDMILLHGSNDPIIPETESQALARALPEGQADLYLLEGLEHVELRPKNISDRMILLQAAARLLEQRDSILERLD